MIPTIDYDRIAELYDIYVTCDFDIPFYLAEARKVSGSVLELMAGTGRLSIPLVENGIDLTCIDSSEKMLEKLRNKLHDKGLTAKVQQADIRQLALKGRFELVLIPFHSLSELTSRDDQKSVLKTIRSCLVDGGVLLCALHNAPVRIKSANGELQSMGNYETGFGTLTMSAVETYDANENIINRKQFYEMYDYNGTLQSKRVLEMPFSLINYSDLENMATEVGYKVKTVYGDYDRADYDIEKSRFMIWVLER
jgi:SAM-dependent methyltransferase